MMLSTDVSWQVQHAESVSGAKGVAVVQANVAHMIRNAQVMSVYSPLRSTANLEMLRSVKL